MGTPHKHAEAIKAWADGKDIEFKDCLGYWLDLTVPTPTWMNAEYRIKPELKDPGKVAMDAWIYSGRVQWTNASSRWKAAAKAVIAAYKAGELEDI